MLERRFTGVVRRWLGSALLVGLVLAGGGLLEASAERPHGEFYIRACLVVGLLASAVYVFAVHLPQRRAERRLRELEELYVSQNATISRSLDDLRSGDLVAAATPVAELPDEMLEAVRGASRALAALIQQIQSSSVEVAAAARTVQRTSSELASASSQQAAAVVEITASTEELARTAGQIAANSAAQAELAAHSESAGDAGAGSVEAAVAGVDAVREHMDAISGRADTLGSRSREIYRVLDLITEIAQETHILSLNAAIEASAAGEHGERFSVVAEEVRRLAERSRESVDTVRSHLDEFTNSIRGVVLATEEGSKAARQVLEQSRSAQESIAQLRGALAETAQAARQISLATQEQRGASDQVAETLREVGEVIHRIADGLNRYTDAADRLNQLALSIQLLTQSFRIESQHSLRHQLLKWTTALQDYSGNLEAVDGLLDDLLEECPYVELAYLVDLSGAMVTYAVNSEKVGERQLPGTVAVGQSYADRPWFQAVTRDGRSAVTPAYKSLLTGDPCFTIAVAVRDYREAMIGTLGVDVNLNNWTKI
ncbi:MAG: methyl-accepting chemotaxis protein [Acidobacteriota bacterium]|nr:methyl-accepting chemotaxis protein [Acidobacteriota bacterium]